MCSVINNNIILSKVTVLIIAFLKLLTMYYILCRPYKFVVEPRLSKVQRKIRCLSSYMVETILKISNVMPRPLVVPGIIFIKHFLQNFDINIFWFQFSHQGLNETGLEIELFCYCYET